MSPRPAPRLLEVRRIERRTPHMLRFVLGGALDGFNAGQFTDEYVKLQFPAPGADYEAPFDPEAIKAERPREAWPRVRTYTVRRWDPDAQELTIDIVTHGDEGVASAWAQRATVGDRLQLVGPGGAYRPDPAADWHLLIGDPCVIPAISATLEQLPAGAAATVVISIDGPDDVQPLPIGDGVSVQWVEGGEDALLAAVASLPFPAGTISAFVHGEASAVRAVRRHLLADRGLPREALSASGYWKRRRTEEGWREDKAEWKRLVEQDDAALA